MIRLHIRAPFFIISVVVPLCCVSYVAGTSCSDGYNLDYVLPMFEQCGTKLVDSTTVQLIPKLIPSSVVVYKRDCQHGNGKISGMPTGYRLCRLPDCLQEPCVNGHCVETIENHTCLCKSGFTGDHCDIVVASTAKSADQLNTIAQAVTTPPNTEFAVAPAITDAAKNKNEGETDTEGAVGGNGNNEDVPTTTAPPTTTTNLPTTEGTTEEPTTTPQPTTPLATTDATTEGITTSATTTSAPTTAPLTTTSAPTTAPLTTTSAPTTAPLTSTSAPTTAPLTTTLAPTTAPLTTTSATTTEPAAVVPFSVTYTCDKQSWINADTYCQAQNKTLIYPRDAESLLTALALVINNCEKNHMWGNCKFSTASNQWKCAQTSDGQWEDMRTLYPWIEDDDVPDPGSDDHCLEIKDDNGLIFHAHTCDSHKSFPMCV